MNNGDDMRPALFVVAAVAVATAQSQTPAPSTTPTTTTARIAGADSPKVVEVPPPTVPKALEFTSSPGRQLQLKIDKPAVWWPLTPGCEVRTPGNAMPSDTATVTAGKAGVYHVAAVTADGAVMMTVTVNGGPLPPDGPIVPPDPPKPSDPLVNDIKTAYLDDKGKVSDMAALASLYRLMIKESGNATYRTVGELNDTFVEARDGMLKDEKSGAVALPTVRRRCAVEAATALGTDPDVALTDKMRDAAKTVYAKLADAVTAATPVTR